MQKAVTFQAQNQQQPHLAPYSNFQTFSMKPSYFCPPNQSNNSSMQTTTSNALLQVNLALIKNTHSSHANMVSGNVSDCAGKRPALDVETKSTNPDIISRIKAPQSPCVFHLYVKNLDVNSILDDVEEYLKNLNIKVFSCEIVCSSSNGSSMRSVAEHVEINLADKDRSLQPGLRESGITVHPWRQPRRNNNFHRNSHY